MCAIRVSQLRARALPTNPPNQPNHPQPRRQSYYGDAPKTTDVIAAVSKAMSLDVIATVTEAMSHAAVNAAGAPLAPPVAGAPCAACDS